MLESGSIFGSIWKILDAWMRNSMFEANFGIWCYQLYTSSWHTFKQEYQERVRVSWPSSEFTTALVRIAGLQETWYSRGVVKSGEIGSPPLKHHSAQ